MAESDKIRSKDIIQENLFDNTIQSAEDLIKTLDAVEKEFIKVADAQSKVAKNSAKNLKTAEDINKVAESINVASQARERAAKIQKERLALEQKLKIANSTAIDQNVELRVQLQEQNKINKELAKEKLGLIDTYTKESKRLNQLRKDYKNLILEEGKATKESSKLLKEIRELDKQLKDIDASVGQFQRSVGDYGKEALGSTKATLGWAAALIGLNGGLDDVKSSLDANEEGSKELSNLTAQASAVFNTFANRAGKAGTELVGFFKEVASGEKSLFDFSETAVNIVNSFEGVVSAAGKAADAAGNASDETFDLNRELLSLNETLVLLNGEFEKQSAIAGDGTRTFDEQQKAAEEAQRINVKRLALQEDIAARELKIIEDRIAGEEDERNLFALQAEASEKRIALQEIQNELNVATIENEKILREIQRDRFERELDFAIDAFDTQKTVNERRIADDRLTLEQRAAILDETIKLTNSSFESQKELFAEFVDDRVDFDALAAETDEAAIRRTLRKLDLDDIELGRALEVIRERKLALQDLEDAEREILDAKLERFQREKDAQDRIRLNDLEFELAQTTDIEEQFKLRAEILEETALQELENAELTAEERREIQRKLNQDLILLEKERVETVQQIEIENRRAIADARLQTAKDIAQIGEIIAGENENAQRAALATQKALAVSEILINSQREISDIRADQQKTDEQKQAQVTQARSRALLGVSTVLAQGTFYDGTEDTGNGGKVDDRGGFYAILHPNERVMTKAQNSKVGDLTNNELADIAMMYNKGELINPMTDLALNLNSNTEKQTDRTHLLVSEISKLRNDINSKPVQQVNVDSFGNLVEVVYRNGVKDTIKYNRKDWI